MAIEIMTLSIYFLGVLVGSMLYNFATIHSVANLILYEGSSRAKSFSISAEFALLSATLFTSAAVLAMLFGADLSLQAGFILFASIGGSGILVELVRIWYVKESYETNYLYAFVIAEGANLFLALVLAILLNTVFGLI